MPRAPASSRARDASSEHDVVNGRPETSPMILIALHFEGGVDVALGRGGAQDLERVAAWVDADELRRGIVLAAAALQARDGVSATDEQLAALAEALRPAPQPPDPLACRVPKGT